MRNNTLHVDAYNEFREYLDATYKVGNNPLSLSMGYPEPGEFPLPKCLLSDMDVQIGGVEKKRPGYGWNAGSLELRESIRDYENLLHGTSYNVNQICMVAGATYAFNRIIENIFCTRDNYMKELIIVAPTYYRMIGRANLVSKVVSVCGKEEKLFQITAQELIDSLTDDTRAIFIANPTNPTYLYYEAEFFEELMPKLKERRIYLIVDESGDAFNIGTGKNRLKSFSKCIGHENIIRIVTGSKKYLLAEYRIGYVIASESFMGTKTGGFIKLIGDDIGNAPMATNEVITHILEYEKKYLLGKEDESVKEYVGELERNNQKMFYLKDIAMKYLEGNKNISHIIQPDSNFNITFKIETRKYKDDMENFYELLKQNNISMLPCSGLGISSELKYFRLTYGINENVLVHGLEELCNFIKRNAD